MFMSFVYVWKRVLTSWLKGVGCHSGREGRLTCRPREPCQLSGCVKRRHKLVHGFLGRFRKSHCLSSHRISRRSDFTNNRVAQGLGLLGLLRC